MYMHMYMYMHTFSHIYTCTKCSNMHLQSQPACRHSPVCHMHPDTLYATNAYKYIHIAYIHAYILQVGHSPVCHMHPDTFTATNAYKFIHTCIYTCIHIAGGPLASADHGFPSSSTCFCLWSPGWVHVA